MEKREKEIIQQALDGDKDAFETLVNTYKERVYWIGFNMLHNCEDARDVSQEAFARVFRSLSRFNPQQNFYTWLYQIVVNLCIDHIRKYSKRSKISLEDLHEMEGYPKDPSQDLSLQETAQKVHLILGTLPPKYRIVIILRDLEGLSCKEIAKVISASHATTRWRLHQARKLFRDQWEKEFGDYPTENSSMSTNKMAEK